MRILRNLLIFAVLALGVALAAQVLLRDDPGLVLLRYGGMDYATSIPRAIAFALAAVAALWLLYRLATAPVIALRRRRERATRQHLLDGLTDLHSGRWERAERALLASDDPDALGVARVHAARAAAARGDNAAAQQHLDALGPGEPGLRAVALAELALAQGRAGDALVALDIPAAQPLPPRGLTLRAQALSELGRFDEAYGMLGALRKHNAVQASDLARLEARWARGSLASAADGNVLASRWDGTPAALRHDPAVVAAYAERAAALHWDDAATRAIEQALDVQWDESLAALYGRLPIGQVDERQARIERWLVQHPSSPGLLASRARLLYAQGDWLQAETALRQAIDRGAGADAWELLGHGYASSGDERRARVAYANALRSARSDALIELPPETAGAGALLRDPRDDDRGLPPRLQ
ncbi:MAG: heme biosynthesis protein HemY [Lysobacter sp.]|nr:MAG: heme biosynthesis protein HemY [Lysobacter sp.]